MNHSVCLFWVLIIFLGIYISPVSAQTGGPYDLSWHTLDSGGGKGTGSDFTLSGTIGQPDADQVAYGGEYYLSSGFWSGSQLHGPITLNVLKASNNIDVELTWSIRSGFTYDVYYTDTLVQPFSLLPGGEDTIPPVLHLNALIDNQNYFYDVSLFLNNK